MKPIHEFDLFGMECGHPRRLPKAPEGTPLSGSGFALRAEKERELRRIRGERALAATLSERALVDGVRFPVGGEAVKAGRTEQAAPEPTAVKEDVKDAREAREEKKTAEDKETDVATKKTSEKTTEKPTEAAEKTETADRTAAQPPAAAAEAKLDVKTVVKTGAEADVKSAAMTEPTPEASGKKPAKRRSKKDEKAEEEARVAAAADAIRAEVAKDTEAAEAKRLAELKEEKAKAKTKASCRPRVKTKISKIQPKTASETPTSKTDAQTAAQGTTTGKEASAKAVSPAPVPVSAPAPKSAKAAAEKTSVKAAGKTTQKAASKPAPKKPAAKKKLSLAAQFSSAVEDTRSETAGETGAVMPVPGGEAEVPAAVSPGGAEARAADHAAEGVQAVDGVEAKPSPSTAGLKAGVKSEPKPEPKHAKKRGRKPKTGHGNDLPSVRKPDEKPSAQPQKKSATPAAAPASSGAAAEPETPAAAGKNVPSASPATAVAPAVPPSMPKGRYSAAAAIGMADALGDAINQAEAKEEPEDFEDGADPAEVEAAHPDEIRFEALAEASAAAEARAGGEASPAGGSATPAADVGSSPSSSSASVPYVESDDDGDDDLEDVVDELDDHDEPPEFPVFEPLDGRRRRVRPKVSDAPGFKKVEEALHPEGEAHVPADVRRARMLAAAGAVTAGFTTTEVAAEIVRRQAEARAADQAVETDIGDEVAEAAEPADSAAAAPEGIPALTEADMKDALARDITAASRKLYPTASGAPTDPSALTPDAVLAARRLRMERELAAIEETKRTLLPRAVDHWYFHAGDGAGRSTTLTEAMTVLTNEEAADVRRVVEHHLAKHVTWEQDDAAGGEDLPDREDSMPKNPGKSSTSLNGLESLPGTNPTTNAASRAATALTLSGLSRAAGGLLGRIRGFARLARFARPRRTGRGARPSAAAQAPAAPAPAAQHPVAVRPDTGVAEASAPSALPPAYQAFETFQKAQRTERAFLAVIAMVACGALGITLHTLWRPEPKDVVVDRAMVESAVAMMRIAQSRPGMPERPELAALTRAGIDAALERLAREQNLRIFVKGAYGAMPEGPMPDVTEAVLASLGITPIERKVLADAVTHHWLMQPAEEALVDNAREVLRPELRNDPVAQEVERIRTEGLTPFEHAARDPRLLEPARMRAEARREEMKRKDEEAEERRQAGIRAAQAEGLTDEELKPPFWERLLGFVKDRYADMVRRGISRDEERNAQMEAQDARAAEEAARRARERTPFGELPVRPLPEPTPAERIERFHEK
ncbi:MAG: hypothetical protein MSS13_04440 [Sutterella parvirubra]|nr:hypothetical protein [Sutterella parvirubra]